MVDKIGGANSENTQAIADSLGAVVPDQLLTQVKDEEHGGVTDSRGLSDIESFDDWQQPFYLKYRLVSLLAVVLSFMWIVGTISFVDSGLG